jgi:hypothetical protein
MRVSENFGVSLKLVCVEGQRKREREISGTQNTMYSNGKTMCACEREKRLMVSVCV